MQQINMVQTKVVINHLTLNIFFFNKTNKRTYQIYQKQSFIFSFLFTDIQEDRYLYTQKENYKTESSVTDSIRKPNRKKEEEKYKSNSLIYMVLFLITVTLKNEKKNSVSSQVLPWLASSNRGKNSPWRFLSKIAQRARSSSNRKKTKKMLWVFKVQRKGKVLKVGVDEEVKVMVINHESSVL